MKDKRRKQRKTLQLLPTQSHRLVRRYLDGLGTLPTFQQWETLLIDAAMKRRITKTDQAAALGLSREGWRRKLLRYAA